MDRVHSDTLRTVDASIVGHGAIDRPAIELPATGSPPGTDGDSDDNSNDDPNDDPDDHSAVPVGETVRLTLDGTTRYCRFDVHDGRLRSTGAFDTPELVHSPGEGENRLREWVEHEALSVGRTVHLDVIEPDFAYGLRAPGESAVYDAPSPPDDSLASIAEQLDGGD